MFLDLCSLISEQDHLIPDGRAVMEIHLDATSSVEVAL
jgi:hypothetical protein